MPDGATEAPVSDPEVARELSLLDGIVSLTEAKFERYYNLLAEV
jgi:hypothetical protein